MAIFFVGKTWDNDLATVYASDYFKEVVCKMYLRCLSGSLAPSSHLRPWQGPPPWDPRRAKLTPQLFYRSPQQPGHHRRQPPRVRQPISRSTIDAVAVDCKTPKIRPNKSRKHCYIGVVITGIKFPPATLIRLQAEAARSGKDLDSLVTKAVEAKIALSYLSLREVLLPIQKAIAESGSSPEDAEAFFEQELSIMRAQRKTSASSSDKQ